MLNAEDNKLNIIVTFITDIILLLIVLVGLIRLRYHGGGTLGLGRLLWKQVAFRGFPSMGYRRPTDVSSVSKGVIWLLLAVAADVPPTVGPALFLSDHCFVNCRVLSQVFIVLNLNGKAAFPPSC